MLTVKEISTDLNLEIIAGSDNTSNVIIKETLSRPGVELAGFLKFYDRERLILIGSKEHQFLKLVPKEQQKEK